MTAMISVASGDAVVGSLGFSTLNADGRARISAIKGARYVLAEADKESAAVGVTVERSGDDLLLTQHVPGSEDAWLTIEDFFAGQSQLLGIGSQGRYEEYPAVAKLRLAGAVEAGHREPVALSLLPALPALAPLGLASFNADATAPAGAPTAKTDAVDVVVSNANVHPAAAQHPGAVSSAVLIGPLEDAVGHAPTPESAETGVDGAVQRRSADIGAHVSDVAAEMTADAGVVQADENVAGAASTSVSLNENGGGVAQTTTVFGIDDLPEISAVLDDQGLIQGVIENGGYTDDGRPQMVGKAEEGVLVHIYRGSELIGQVFADANGDWAFTPRLPLADGRHVITIIHEYPDGDVSDVSPPYVIHVDKSVPETPLITGILDDEGRITGVISEHMITDDNRPTIDGTAEAHATVIIYDKGKQIGTAEVDADGNWSFTPDLPLVDGTHLLSYAAIDRAGNASEPSSVFEFVVDTRPEKINIFVADDDVGSVQGAVFSGAVTDDNTPTLTGSATAGGIVSIYEGAVLLGQVTADVDGTWQFTPSALSEGAHTFHATVTLVAKGESEPSKLFNLTVDLTPPSQPSIEQVLDDVGAIVGLVERDGRTDDAMPTLFDDQGDMQGSLTTGATTDDAKPVLNGKAEAHTIVIIKDQGVEIGRALADAGGRWSFEPVLPLLQGAHAFTVVSVDGAGNGSVASSEFLLGVLTDARPSAPAILGVIDDVGGLTGIIPKHGVTDDVRPTVYGTAQAGSIVSLYIDDVLLGTTQSDSKGSWSFVLSVDVPEGLHNFHATATSGDEISAKTGSYPIVVDTTPPAAPGASDAALWDLVGDEITPIVNGTVTDDRTPAFNGKAEAKVTIIIYDQGVEIGRTETNAAGNWMFSPMPVLADGPHSFSYAIADKAGNISPKSAAINFVVDTSGVAVSIEGADDDVGSKQGAITDGGVTDDTRPSIHGKAIPGGIVTVYDGGLVLGQTVAAVDGTWRFAVDTAMRSGLHSLTAKVFSEAGVELGASAVFYLMVDINPPGRPHIEQIIDDVGGQQGWLNNGQSTDDGTPTLAGTAEAGILVRIYDNNSLLGSVVADADGVWSFTPTTLLNNGKHVFTVTAVDEAGNASIASDPYTVIVDTVVAVAPSIDSAFDDKGDMQGTLSSGATTDDAKPVLSGRAEAGTVVIIKDHGIEIGRSLVGENGRWSFEPTLPLSQGAHAFTAEAVDAAGNLSAVSRPFSLQVFIEHPPEPAAITSVSDDVGSIIGAVQKGGVTNDARPTISGTAPLGMTVSVYIDDLLVGSTMADGRGYWSFTPANALADGSHQFSAVATNGLGGTSTRTGSYTVIVDTVSPLKPGGADAVLWGDAGQINGGATTNDSTPTFTGRSEANATVLVFDKGREIGRAATDATGNWTFTPVPALVGGQHRLAYAVMDAAGNTGPQSDEIAFVVDVSLVLVSIDGAVDDVGGKQGNTAGGSVIDDTTPTLFGRAIVGGIVKVYEGTTLLGQTVVAIDGSWRLTPAFGLGEGAHSLHATVTAPGQSESGASAPFNVMVDISAPDTPTITRVLNDVGNIQGVLSDGQTADDTTPTLVGSAEAGSTVSIYGNGSLLGIVQAASNGEWSFTPTTPLINGEHVFTVTSTDRAGNVSAASASYTVVVDTIAPDKPTIDAAYDDQGKMQGTLASGDDTDDQLPVFNGKAEAGCVVVLLDNGIEIGRVVADPSGRWSYPTTVPLSPGEHAFTLTAIDAAGNVSVPSNGFHLTVVLDASVDPLLAPGAVVRGSDDVSSNASEPVLATSFIDEEGKGYEPAHALGLASSDAAETLPQEALLVAGDKGALVPSLRSMLSGDGGMLFQHESGVREPDIGTASAGTPGLVGLASSGDYVSSWMQAGGDGSALQYSSAAFAAGYEGGFRADELVMLYAV